MFYCDTSNIHRVFSRFSRSRSAVSQEAQFNSAGSQKGHFCAVYIAKRGTFHNIALQKGICLFTGT